MVDLVGKIAIDVPLPPETEPAFSNREASIRNASNSLVFNENFVSNREKTVIFNRKT